jgi:hypothetical protein
MLIVGGIDVDSICNARYLASHPDDNTSADEAAHNPDREGWLPGQTNLYADDPEAHNNREIYGPNAAWHWTCGRPEVGTPVTQGDMTQYCQVEYSGTNLQAWVGNDGDAYSWKCVASQ